MSIIVSTQWTVDRRRSQPSSFLSNTHVLSECGVSLGGPNGLFRLAGAVNPQPSDPVAAAPGGGWFSSLCPEWGCRLASGVGISMIYVLTLFNDR
jgi:hypothetical protein